MAKRGLSLIEREALLIRHQAAMRLVRTDPDLSPEEALLLVIAPSAALREVSLREARERMAAAREIGCHRCHTEVDADGFCPACAEVTLEAAVVAA